MRAGGEDAESGQVQLRRLGVLEGGDQAGAQQGGLAAAGRPEHRREPLAAQQDQEVGGEPVTAEEPCAVTSLEPHQSLVRRFRSLPVICVAQDGNLVHGLLPPGFPLCRITPTRRRVGQHHRQRGELLTAGCLRQRRDRIPGPLRQHPVGDPSRLGTQFAQLESEPLHRASSRIHRHLTTPRHTATPVNCPAPDRPATLRSHHKPGKIASGHCLAA